MVLELGVECKKLEVIEARPPKRAASKSIHTGVDCTMARYELQSVSEQIRVQLNHRIGSDNRVLHIAFTKAMVHPDPDTVQYVQSHW